MSNQLDYEEPDEHEPFCTVPVTPELLRSVRAVCDYLYAKRDKLPDNVLTHAIKLDEWRFEMLAPAIIEDLDARTKEPDYSEPPY